MKDSPQRAFGWLAGFQITPGGAQGGRKAAAMFFLMTISAVF